MFGNDAIEPLRAVLNSYWLDYHVTTMMLSYGAFTIAFATALLYLLSSAWPRVMRWAPPLEALDLYTYRAIQFGWPLLGIGIVLGAVWADTAWGRMWSWDPKETWSLITWLIYTGYLHVRLVHGWKGTVMAWSSILGYGAVMFTYIGVNFVLSGRQQCGHHRWPRRVSERALAGHLGGRDRHRRDRGPRHLAPPPPWSKQACLCEPKPLRG